MTAETTTLPPRAKRRKAAAAQRTPSRGKRLYEAGCTKRRRRTKAEIEDLENSLRKLASDHEPLSLRNLFYLAVSRGLIGKSENEYNNVIIRLLGRMREDGRVPWRWIVDHNRMRRQANTWDSLEEMLRFSQFTYRRSLWTELPERVELWCESNSAAGVLWDTADEWDVPLMAGGGFFGKSFLYATIKEIEAIQKPTTIYYFGDYDPSGLLIPDSALRFLERHGPRLEIDFQALAVTREQVDSWDLPTAPPKSSKHRAGFDDTRTTQLEAIPPDTLREHAAAAMAAHIPEHVLENTRQVEQLERETLARIMERE